MRQASRQRNRMIVDVFHAFDLVVHRVLGDLPGEKARDRAVPFWFLARAF
jgi:hypothetical protein